MGTTMNTETYHGIIDEDIDWLLQQPHSLEKDHILAILKYEKKRRVTREDGSHLRLACSTCNDRLYSCKTDSDDIDEYIVFRCNNCNRTKD